jgi:hypothetical protein
MDRPARSYWKSADIQGNSCAVSELEDNLVTSSLLQMSNLVLHRQAADSSAASHVPPSEGNTDMIVRYWLNSPAFGWAKTPKLVGV